MSQSLDNVMQALQQLQAKVQAMPRGGNLESLVDEGLKEVDREAFEVILSARHQQTAASEPEDSPPPYRVSSMQRDAAARRDAAPESSDPSR